MKGINLRSGIFFIPFIPFIPVPTAFGFFQNSEKFT